MNKLLLAGSLCLASTASAQQIIEWNYNNRASAGGSGCNRNNTEFISAGNEVSVIFSGLGVDLSGYAGGKLTALKKCKLVIPTKVRAGYYLAKLHQTITYGYNRTEGTDGKVSLVSRFYNQGAGRVQKNVPTRGLARYDEPWAEAKTKTLWQVRPSWCQRQAYQGNFKAQLSVSGYRRSTDQSIVVQIDGHDIRLDALGTPLLCPR